MRRWMALLAAVAGVWAGAAGAAEVTVLRGALVYPVAGAAIPNGVLVVEDGRIAAVGTAASVAVPAGAKVIDLAGKVLVPGLVDTHSHIGDGDGADRSAPLQPDNRIFDAINPMADTLMKARAGGITTVNVMSGSGHLLSGQTAYLKLRRGATRIEDLLFCKDVYREICGGLKMANGTNSLRPEPPFPGTRAKSAALVRQMFVKAKAYRAKIEAAKGDPKKLPDRDLQMEALLQALEGRRIVHFHTHRAEDIATVIRLSREFGIKPVLHHLSEGWKVAPQIAAAGLPGSITVLDSPGGKLEASEARFETGAVLDRAGVRVAFNTDDSITDSRLLLRSAALGVRAGLSREKALVALTLAGAEMLGLQKRIGTLEPGKDADFVVLSGDPFSVYTHVLETWVEGRRVFDRNDPADRKFATGGYAVYRGDFYEDEEAK